MSTTLGLEPETLGELGRDGLEALARTGHTIALGLGDTRDGQHHEHGERHQTSRSDARLTAHALPPTWTGQAGRSGPVR